MNAKTVRTTKKNSKPAAAKPTNGTPAPEVNERDVKHASVEQLLAIALAAGDWEKGPAAGIDYAAEELVTLSDFAHETETSDNYGLSSALFNLSCRLRVLGELVRRQEKVQS